MGADPIPPSKMIPSSLSQGGQRRTHPVPLLKGPAYAITGGAFHVPGKARTALPGGRPRLSRPGPAYHGPNSLAGMLGIRRPPVARGDSVYVRRYANRLDHRSRRGGGVGNGPGHVPREKENPAGGRPPGEREKKGNQLSDDIASSGRWALPADSYSKHNPPWEDDGVVCEFPENAASRRESRPNPRAKTGITC